MNIRQHLLLQEVQRYPISYVNRPQSVAEHSYNVLLIAMWLVEDSDDIDLRREVMEYAIVHDMEEVRTGDIPSPFKRDLRLRCPDVVKYLDGEHFVLPEVRAIVKLADCIEAIYYIQEFGGSRYTMDYILPDIKNNFEHIANTSGVRDPIRIRAKFLEKHLNDRPQDKAHERQ